MAAGCATENTVTIPSSAGVYKVGKPYQIDGTWYYPHEQPDYDETGIASWYGPTFYGKPTANGEVFNADSLSAAHRTLPMPVNVRVTNLENGKSLIVRVNDRGPYAKSRIIDVSERAAKLLGFYSQGTARVRVSYVGRADLPNGRFSDETPPEIASAVPAAPTSKIQTAALDVVPGGAAVAPIETAPLPRPIDAGPPDLRDAQPSGEVTKVTVPSMTHLYVQAGAFSSYENANRLRARLSGAGNLQITSVDRAGQKFYRLRLGPFDRTEDADAALDRLTRSGSNDAKVVVDR